MLVNVIVLSIMICIIIPIVVTSGCGCGCGCGCVLIISVFSILNFMNMSNPFILEQFITAVTQGLEDKVRRHCTLICFSEA